ncbi:hypothetical protein BV898_16675, partial [Hypsibius exemplaris]
AYAVPRDVAFRKPFPSLATPPFIKLVPNIGHNHRRSRKPAPPAVLSQPQVAEKEFGRDSQEFVSAVPKKQRELVVPSPPVFPVADDVSSSLQRQRRVRPSRESAPSDSTNFIRHRFAPSNE